MVTVQEAAREKGVSDSRIYQWLGEGRLKRHQQFGRVVVDLTEVMALEELKRGWPKGKSRK